MITLSNDVAELQEQIQLALLTCDNEICKNDYGTYVALVDVLQAAADILERQQKRIEELDAELAGKNEVIRVLKEDVAFYKRYQDEKYSKDWKDQMIQDQGVEE